MSFFQCFSILYFILFFSFFQIIYIFGFGIPLFIDASETTNRVKWGLWIVHKLLLTAIYGFILFMHHSKWRERLPGNHSFTYTLFAPSSIFLFLVKLMLFNFYYLYSEASLLQLHLCNVLVICHSTVWLRPGRKWSWVWILVQLYRINLINFVKHSLLTVYPIAFYRLYNLATVCYHSLYLPLIYVTFLADFFQVPN